MKKTFTIIIVCVAAAVFLLSACATNNAAPTVSTALVPSVSLSGTPYITAGPSSTVTIKVTPLPNGTESIVPTPPNDQPGVTAAPVPAAS